MSSLYNISVYLIFILAVVVFTALFFVSAPYGKFSRSGWGPAIRSKWAWLIMESPSPVLIFLFFLTSDNKSIPTLIFVTAWLVHYFHRTFIYPFRQSGKEKSFPLVLVLMAIIFNGINGFINGFGVFHLKFYELSWLLSWQFISGFIIFLAGFAVNKIADEKLKLLRKKNPVEYVIPEGWLFRYVSCPHYFGEIIEWGGWAVMTWSVPGLAFFVFTVANLLPRAISSHRWYKAHFRDYPAERKAVLPFLI